MAFPDLLTLLCQFTVAVNPTMQDNLVFSQSKCTAFPVELGTPLAQHFNTRLRFAFWVSTAWDELVVTKSPLPSSNLHSKSFITRAALSAEATPTPIPAMAVNPRTAATASPVTVKATRFLSPWTRALEFVRKTCLTSLPAPACRYCHKIIGNENPRYFLSIVAWGVLCN